MVRGRAGPAGPAAAGWVERAPPGLPRICSCKSRIIPVHCSAVQSKGKVATDWGGEIRSLRHYGY